ncbi:hypothetical protein PI125_g16709 [Phytophthora idaei]|nr:hypothetical protein PI125_g16709 [Phytophthora idaei]KAG3141241.1 hypothetical protein PI126_g15593 [Phytophthora idaei]
MTWGSVNSVTNGVADVEEETTVLVEGLPELDATVKVARTLCTDQSGKHLVGVRNASTEEVVVRRGTMVAVATVESDSALGFEGEDPNEEAENSVWVDAVISAAAAASTESRDPMPGLDKLMREALDVDFGDYKLSDEQNRLMRELLELF